MKALVRATTVLGVAGATFVASFASAHVRLVSPTPRYASPMGQDTGANIKDGPCGRMNDSRTTDMSRVTVLEPGATIMVTFNETIDHPGHFRIAFDDDGQDAFVTPLMRSQVQTGPTFTAPVLLDSIPDKSGGMYTSMVTLPNVECERCTLQLIQVMTTAASWMADDIYYTCADIALRRTGGGGGMGGMGGSGGSSQGGSAGASAGSSGAGGAATGGMTGLGGAGAGGAGGAGTCGNPFNECGGGTSPTGGVATGGALTGGTGGMTATGGVPAGGAPTGGAPTAGQAPIDPNPPADEAGCGCRSAPSRMQGTAFTAAALALLGMFVRRRRGSRPSAV